MSLTHTGVRTAGAPTDDTAAARAAATPAVAHSTFRAVLDAVARPGTRHRLPDPAVPAVLLPVLALAGLGVGVAVCGDASWTERWTDPVLRATDATSAEPSRARLVVLGPGAPADVLERVAVGRAAAPEEGALVAVAVANATDRGEPLSLTGPGVDGRATVAPLGLPAAWRRARARAAFPAGFDLLLIDERGDERSVVGLPRSTTIDRKGA